MARSDDLPRSFTLSTEEDRYPWHEAFTKPLESEYSFVIPELRSIRGRLIHADATRVLSRPWVLAHLDGFPPEHLPSSADPTNPSVRMVRADDAGEFVISGLLAHSVYQLTAGGGGVGTRNSKSWEVPSAAPCEIEVEGLFGAQIQVVGLGEAPLWEAPGFQWFWSPDRSGASGLDLDSISARLSGIDETERAVESPNPKTMLFLGPYALESLGPIWIQGTPAGCFPLDRNVFVPRVSEGLSSIRIEADCRTIAKGTVLVRFRNLPAGDDRVHHRARRFGRVLLWPLDDQGGVLHCPFLSWGSQTPLEIDDVPVGRYRVSLSTEGGFANHPSENDVVEVRSGSTCEASFELGQSCSAEAVILTRDGKEHTGEALIGSVRSDDGTWSTAYFPRPPYLVQGLVPGDYLFTIYRPFHDPQPIQVSLTTLERTASVVFESRE